MCISGPFLYRTAIINVPQPNRTVPKPFPKRVILKTIHLSYDYSTNAGMLRLRYAYGMFAVRYSIDMLLEQIDFQRRFVARFCIVSAYRQIRITNQVLKKEFIYSSSHQPVQQSSGSEKLLLKDKNSTFLSSV